MSDINEELASKPSKLKIFVSSRTKGLEHARAAAVDVINNNPIAFAWHWEHDAFPGPYDIEEVCVANAKTSDGLVLILGGDLSEVVVKEFESAHKAGVPCYPFVKQVKYRTPEVTKFIGRLRGLGYVTRNFQNESELQTFVANAVDHFHVTAIRRVIIQQRSDRRDTISMMSHSSMVAPNVYAVVLGSAEAALSAGRPVDALRLIDELKQSNPALMSDPSARAWTLNVEGLAHDHSGHYSEATSRFEQMLAVGQELEDNQIQSTATQNLGIGALREGRYDDARGFSEQSMRLSQQIGDYYAATQVILNLAGLALTEGDSEEAEKSLQLGFEGCRLFSDPGLFSTAYGLQGNLAAHHRDYLSAETAFRKALRSARQAKDRPKELQSLQNLGAVNVDLGLVAKAIRWYRRALTLAEDVHDPELLLGIHQGLSTAYICAEQFDKAAAELRIVRSIAEQLNNDMSYAIATANLGAILLNTGAFDLSRPLLSDARETFRKLSDEEWQVRVLLNTTVLFTKLGDAESAIGAVDDALKIATAVSFDIRDELSQLAIESLLSIRDIDRAVEYFERSIQDAKLIEPTSAIAVRYTQGGARFRDAGATRQAMGFFERAITRFRELEDDENLFHALNDHAIQLVRLGNLRGAIAEFEECVRISLRLTNRAIEQQATMNMGDCLTRAGDRDQAIEVLSRSLKLARSLADDHAVTWTLTNLAIALGDSERWEDAETASTEALALARYLRDARLEAAAIGGLGRVAFARGHYGRSAQRYRRAAELGIGSGDIRHGIEDLAGLLESLAARGRIEEIEPVVQRVVDLSQEWHEEELASVGLARAARWLVAQNLFDDAADLYAVAMLIAAASSLIEPDWDMLVRAALYPIIHMETKDVQDQELMIEAIVKSSGEHGEDAAEIVRHLLQMAAEFRRNENSAKTYPEQCW